ncbi:hypothetical protein [Vibrio aphrogenes]|uniref:hypothetical protein n=1 Tax=Vibrio aphrogenes TaxID=1891186 RepID=UPI000B35810B|nr:hypothetical protein [Vibrio aphrogenes]
MKAYTIPLSFCALLLLSACSSQPSGPQLLAQSQPVEIATSETQRSTPQPLDEQAFIQHSQQQARTQIAQELVGTYQSQANAGLTTTLVLNADHSAITRYEYQNGDPSLIENGFWQQDDDGNIQVLMTEHDGRNINALRIFTVDGFQLTAEKEIVNGMEYQLGSHGLIVQKMKVETSLVPSDKQATQGLVTALTAANIAGSNQYNAQVDATLRHYFKINRTDPKNNRYRWLTYDLNNDQKPELFVLTDWCGSGGCTVLMFENHNDQWQFNSRITQVHTPIQVTNYHHFGWRDLIIPVSGGGVPAAHHLMSYTGVSYPLNASTAPVTSQSAAVNLFSDNISAAQQGITM